MGVGRLAAKFVAKSAEKPAHKKALLKPRRAGCLKAP
jgi:hypothetical protein